MNSKSSNHFRHSVDAFDIKKLSFYYAIESRIFNAVWNDELNKYARGPLWFTNIMVFDFDFDEKHFPNVEDYEKKLSSSLSKLESILGKPKYKIYNKNQDSYSDWQKDIYFTKVDANGESELNLPKKYGCQVVYELKESLQSQYTEQVGLYSKLRLKITKDVDADENFKGHMFKNFYNKNLFKIEESKEYDTVDICSLAIDYLSVTKEKIDKIKSLLPFEQLNVNKPKRLPKSFLHLNNKLFCFYQDLNSWKNKGVDYSNKVNYANSKSNCSTFKSTDSRNGTLFNYLRSLPLNIAKSATYGEIISSKLFKNCSIMEPLEEVEFNTTKESVILYREENDMNNGNEFYAAEHNIDNRVFKIDQCALDLEYLNKNKLKLEKIALMLKTNNGSKRKIKVNWENSKITLDLYKNDGNASKQSVLLANIFCLFGPEEILSNVRNIFTPDFVTFLNETVSDEASGKFGLYDMYCIIKDAVYMTHFKYYHSIQNFRKSTKKKPFKALITQRASKSIINRKNILIYGVSYKGNTLGFSKFYGKLIKSKLLKESGMPMPISFYQQYFHMRNTEATLFVRRIKSYLKLIAVKCITDSFHLKITSVQNIHLIKSFIIKNNIRYTYYIKNMYYDNSINIIKYYDTLYNKSLYLYYLFNGVKVHYI